MSLSHKHCGIRALRPPAGNPRWACLAPPEAILPPKSLGPTMDTSGQVLNTIYKFPSIFYPNSHNYLHQSTQLRSKGYKVDLFGLWYLSQTAQKEVYMDVNPREIEQEREGETLTQDEMERGFLWPP